VLHGDVVALSGNRAALARGVRYVSRDLNRKWHAPYLEQLRTRALSDLEGEEREQRELVDVFVTLERRASRLVVLDLHTTSGPSEPFVCTEAEGPSRAIANALPVVTVLGLERKLEGTMLSWCTARGHIGVSFEAGRHDDPAAGRRHVAAIWRVLLAAGALDVEDAVGLETFPAPSANRCGRVVEVRHRHVVEEGDEFEMLGRFQSFDPIDAGQIVARDRRGPVRAPESGLLLMPRYQSSGEDGFFVAREV
jgi:succinylglutamate desuccinylase